MSGFLNLNIPQTLIDKLTEMGYATPTEIQAKSIPSIIEGRDILASSKTGSGKTGAFVIPIITKIMANPETAALILVPTRELALQINEVVSSMRGKERLNTAVIFGGASMDNQVFALKKSPKIIIATPGRLQDHMKRKNVDLANFNILILDEFDRMLDMGFRDDIANIVHRLPQERQTLMFSATKRGSVIAQAKSYLKNFVEVNIESPKETHANIEQKFIELREEEKYPTLLKLITETEGSVLIFVNMKRIADDIESWLQSDGIKARAIHGDLRQRQRENITKQYREEKFQVMIATDVMARGIDISHIKLVINYDTPRAFEDYTHRIGRTGRGGSNGVAITFVTRSEKSFHSNILKQIDSDTAEPVFGRKSSGGGRNQRGVHGGRAGRSFGDRQFSEKRSFGDRPQRNDRNDRDGNRHDGERKFNDRDGNRFERNDRNNDRGERTFGERRPQRDGNKFERNDRPDRDGNREGGRTERSFGDRPQRSDRDSSRFERGERNDRTFERPRGIQGGSRDGGQRDGNRDNGVKSRVKSFFSRKKD